MIHPSAITAYVRAVKWLERHRIFSFGLLPRSVIQVQGVPAPVGRQLTHPYPWDRNKRARSSGREQPETSRSRDLPYTRIEQVEYRQSEHFPRRQPGGETEPRAARSRGR